MGCIYPKPYSIYLRGAIPTRRTGWHAQSDARCSTWSQLPPAKSPVYELLPALRREQHLVAFSLPCRPPVLAAWFPLWAGCSAAVVAAAPAAAAAWLLPLASAVPGAAFAVLPPSGGGLRRQAREANLISADTMLEAAA